MNIFLAIVGSYENGRGFSVMYQKQIFYVNVYKHEKVKHGHLNVRTNIGSFAERMLTENELKSDEFEPLPKIELGTIKAKRAEVLDILTGEAQDLDEDY